MRLSIDTVRHRLADRIEDISSSEFMEMYLLYLSVTDGTYRALSKEEMNKLFNGCNNIAYTNNIIYYNEDVQYTDIDDLAQELIEQAMAVHAFFRGLPIKETVLLMSNFLGFRDNLFLYAEEIFDSLVVNDMEIYSRLVKDVYNRMEDRETPYRYVEDYIYFYINDKVAHSVSSHIKDIATFNEWKLVDFNDTVIVFKTQCGIDDRGSKTFNMEEIENSSQIIMNVENHAVLIIEHNKLDSELVEFIDNANLLKELCLD